jgi:hypothetical protein
MPQLADYSAEPASSDEAHEAVVDRHFGQG